jgi:hypothetical protein
MAAAAACAALRALPGGGALDEPVLEYLAGAIRDPSLRVTSQTVTSANKRECLLSAAGALVDLADVREGGADAASGACCVSPAMPLRCLTPALSLSEVLSAFFEPPPDAAACAAVLRAVAAALSAPPPEAPAPAESAPQPSTALNAFAADFSAALPDLPRLPSAGELALGFASGSDSDSDGEWWRDAELEADPGPLWGGAASQETTAELHDADADAAWQWQEGDDGGMDEDETHAEGAAAAEGAIRALSARFEGIDQSVICGVLLSLGCDVAAAEAALEEIAAAPPPPPPPPPALDDAMSFPSLGGGAPQAAPARVERGWGAAPAAGFAAALVARGGAGGGAAPPQSGVAARARPASLAARAPGGSGPASNAAARWVDTGASVAAMYGQLRDEARDHVRLRNACFQQATQAFLAGDGALAKRLAAQGRRHAAAMFAAHDAASEAIFDARNAEGATAAPGAPPMLVRVPDSLCLLRLRVDLL